MEERMADPPSPGTLSADREMYFLPERESYRAASQLAGTISDRALAQIRGQDPVAIADLSFLNDLSNLAAVVRQLEGIRSAYASLTPAGREEAEAGRGMESASGAESIATLGSIALGALALLKEDVAYQGIRTVVDPLAFRIAVAGAIRRRRPTQVVLIPDMVSIETTSGQSNLAQKLQAVRAARGAAWRASAPRIRLLAQKDAELDRAARAGDQTAVDRLTAQLAKLRADLDPLTRPMEDADRLFGELEGNLFAAAEGNLTLFARLLRAEAIQKTTPKILHVGIVSSGGHNRLSRHLLRLFFLGDGLSWTGGAVCRWALLDKSGSVVDGGVSDASHSSSSWREFWRR
jgi:hypothetical protein